MRNESVLKPSHDASQRLLFKQLDVDEEAADVRAHRGGAVVDQDQLFVDGGRVVVDQRVGISSAEVAGGGETVRGTSRTAVGGREQIDDAVDVVVVGRDAKLVSRRNHYEPGRVVAGREDRIAVDRVGAGAV